MKNHECVELCLSEKKLRTFNRNWHTSVQQMIFPLRIRILFIKNVRRIKKTITIGIEIFTEIVKTKNN